MSQWVEEWPGMHISVDSYQGLSSYLLHQSVNANAAGAVSFLNSYLFNSKTIS